MDVFTREKIPQNNFSCQNFSVENKYVLSFESTTNILQPFLGIVDFDNLITSLSYTQELN